jgi:prephenate dehydrogenase
MDEDGFTLKKIRVAIIGLGLMGASLAIDLRGHCAEIIGVSRKQETLKFALDHQIVDRIANFNPELECELIIFAAPVRTILQQLQQMSNYKYSDQDRSKTVVLDLGSTKKQVLREMEALPNCFDPIGGHPMCGKEVSGIQHAEADLYRNKTFVLTPLRRTSAKALVLVKEMINVIGGIPLILTAEKQDELVAMTSHLPYLLASALMTAAISRNDDQLWSVASSGFRDTSRLAASDLTMMIDILLTNRDPILGAVKDCRSSLDVLAKFISDMDEISLRECLFAAQQKRIRLFKGDN